MVIVWRLVIGFWWFRVLDIGQSNDGSSYLFAGDITSLMSRLMSNLPHLTHLDISGTNLAGWVREQPPSHWPTSYRSYSLLFIWLLLLWIAPVTPVDSRSFSFRGNWWCILMAELCRTTKWKWKKIAFFIRIHLFAFSALMLSVGHWEGHPTCKWNTDATVS